MVETELNIYTDASFNKTKEIAVVGFLIFTNSSEHKNNDTQAAIYQERIIQEKNNIRSELRGFIFALEFLKDNPGWNQKEMSINIYNDCQNITNLMSRRNRLEEKSFMSIRSGKLLENADLYKIFYQLNEIFNPNIIWVKGHTPEKNRTFVNENFSYLDKLVRKKLRMTTKE
jgi:ribonuclease HI